MKPGPAQLDLIRRYSRTLRELHADAMRVQGPRIGARAARAARNGAPAEPAVRAAQAMAADDVRRGGPSVSAT